MKLINTYKYIVNIYFIPPKHKIMSILYIYICYIHIPDDICVF